MYIFDIDGTLLNTIDSISFHINKTLEEFGLGQIDKERVRAFVGNGPVVLVNKTLDFVGASREESFRKKFLDTYNKSYDDDPTYLLKAYGGIKESIDILKDRGEIIACFSNKPDSTCKKVIGHVFGKDYFDFILGYKESYERKPSPEGIMIIKERFGVDFSDILYFGDSEVDMKCGKNSGIFTVGCSWGFRSREILEKESPNLIIDDPKEIKNIRRI